VYGKTKVAAICEHKRKKNIKGIDFF